MKRKLRNIAWIILLLALSFPTGYIVNYVDNKRFVRSEFIMNIIVGGIAGTFVFGLISVIIFIIAKNRKAADPAKPALLVSSVLMLIMLVTFSFRMPTAIKERDRYEFMSGFREKLNDVFQKKIKETPDAPPGLAAHSAEICVCIYWELKRDDALVDELMIDPDPRTFLLRNPKMKKIADGCFGLYLE